jgi:hypothetical protein
VVSFENIEGQYEEKAGNIFVATKKERLAVCFQKESFRN